jgi:hypothetical protein
MPSFFNARFNKQLIDDSRQKRFLSVLVACRLENRVLFV